MTNPGPDPGQREAAAALNALRGCKATLLAQAERFANAAAADLLLIDRAEKLL